MAKFKVGDRVVGNKKAEKYGITCEGWHGKVVGIDKEEEGGEEDICVKGKNLFNEVSKFWVSSLAFDLESEKSDSSSKPDDRSKKTGEKPYKRLVVIKITDDGATAEYIVGKNHAKGVSIRRHPKDKPNDKYAALYAVSKLFGLKGTVEKFVPKTELNDLKDAIANARDNLGYAEQIMKNITAAGR